MKLAKRKVWGLVITVVASIVAFGIIAGGLSYFWDTEYAQKKFVYKWPYGKVIHQYSHKNKLDPYLVVAVIKEESGFDEKAESKPGALGLMQIMPATGAFIARQTEFPNFKADLLKLPELNIRFGCWYLAALKEEFRGNEVLMLAAYNAGRGNVREWMKQKGWDYTFRDAEAIPFPATRRYVQKVLETREQYKKYYKENKDKVLTI